MFFIICSHIYIQSEEKQLKATLLSYAGRSVLMQMDGLELCDILF